MTWVSMVAMPDPRLRDPAFQERLRANAQHRGAAELVRAITVNSYRNHDWPTRGACAHPDLQPFFFAKYQGNPLDPTTNLKVEMDRAKRLETARTICVGDPDRDIPACPVWANCLAWRINVGGQDKHSFAAGLSWRSIRDLSAAIRRIALLPPSTPTELVAC